MSGRRKENEDSGREVARRELKNSRDESQREVRHELRSPAVTSSEGLDVLDQRKGGMSLRTGVTQDYTRKRKRKGDRQYVAVQVPAYQGANPASSYKSTQEV